MSSKRKDKNEKLEPIKIVMLGNGGVGKTSLIFKYLKDSFNENPLQTTNPEGNIKRINVNGKNYVLDIWDTAGQEKYRSLGKLYVKNAKIAILVYDISNQKSFEGVEYWYNFIKEGLGQELILGLAGNKMDLYEYQEVSEEKAQECADNWGAVFSPLSAKEDREGIEKFFLKLLNKYLENKPLFDDIDEQKESLKLQNRETIVNNDSSCCGGGKNPKEKGIKIVFLGSNGVGKTNIISLISGKEINKKYEHTKKNKNKKISFILEDRKKIKVHLIDTNGDDCSEIDMKNIIEESKIFFLVFDYKNRKSFEAINTMVSNILACKKDSKFINIIGNKSNLSKGEKELVTKEEAEEFAKANTCHYESFSIEKIESLQDLIKKNINNYITE